MKSYYNNKASNFSAKVSSYFTRFWSVQQDTNMYCTHWKWFDLVVRTKTCSWGLWFRSKFVSDKGYVLHWQISRFFGGNQSAVPFSTNICLFALRSCIWAAQSMNETSCFCPWNVWIWMYYAIQWLGRMKTSIFTILEIGCLCHSTQFNLIQFESIQQFHSCHTVSESLSSCYYHSLLHQTISSACFIYTAYPGRTCSAITDFINNENFNWIKNEVFAHENKLQTSRTFTNVKNSAGVSHYYFKKCVMFFSDFSKYFYPCFPSSSKYEPGNLVNWTFQQRNVYGNVLKKGSFCFWLYAAK